MADAGKHTAVRLRPSRCRRQVVTFFSAIFATAQPSERGAASGTASVFLDLAMGGGPMLLGLAAQAGGIPFAFGLAAAVALARSGWILALSRHAQHAAR
ncbi:MAG TPA: hypothetical protein VIQ76_08415 [Propionibacteriaceae bacterium]